MYKEYFGLKENPFSISPDPHYFYMSEGHREAMAHLLYGIKSESGFVLLTGEVGTGKTTVCRCVLEQIPEDTEIAFILNPKMTVEELLANICDEFGIKYPPDTRSNRVFVSLINEYLLDTRAKGKKAILLIEEAQNLSVEVLEQIRLLTNLETNQYKLLQIIMLGQPELKEMLSRPELRQLSQRITARYHLGPLSKREISSYLEHRLSAAGLIRGHLFTKSALRRLYRLTGGVPRLINVICDRALTGAYVQGKEQVDARILTAAAREVSGRSASRRPRLRAYQLVCAGVLLFLCIAGIAAYNIQKTRTLSMAIPSAKTQEPSGISGIETGALNLEKPADAAQEMLKDKAYEVLFGKWDIHYDPESYLGPCEQARRQGLQCVEDKGSLTVLRQMNRPAVLKLWNGSDEYYATLTSLNGDTASFALGGEVRVVDIKEISPRWSGDYVLLWRAPPGYKGGLKSGNVGVTVAWLDRQLAMIQKREPSSAQRPFYDEKLAAQVKEFQVTAGLVPSGIAGPRTIICVAAAAGDGGPVLRLKEESN
ncbi:MAG: AAA family ATPase [Syntrophobacterales bacterium]|jgi:general secretion pathway protein A|nr:AAA family ATPase [Syntrophobacterales bacterium]